VHQNGAIRANEYKIHALRARGNEICTSFSTQLLKSSRTEAKTAGERIAPGSLLWQGRAAFGYETNHFVFPVGLTALPARTRVSLGGSPGWRGAVGGLLFLQPGRLRVEFQPKRVVARDGLDY
jgi:hypothetical protein